MNAYIFQAALLCETCGKATQDQLRATTKELHPTFDENNESSFDSDYFPKGPYPYGGGEADSPQHCDHCGVFLENALTKDGESYVREKAEQFETKLEAEGHTDASWEDIAQRAESSGHLTEADWFRYYFAPGQ